MLLFLFALLVFCAAGQSLRGWCQGRIICSNEDLDSRVCLLREASLDLTVSADSDVYLTNSRPATAALALGPCDENKPEVPLLRNAFGIMASSKVYGDVEVRTGVTLPECGGRHFLHGDLTDQLMYVLQRASSVTVMLNRDMTCNIFHILCNTMYPLFRIHKALGVDFSSSRTRIAIIDSMSLSGVESELLNAIQKGSRVDRLVPNSVTCFPALVVGANRHWRAWLHRKSRFGELIPFAVWLKNAFRIGTNATKAEHSLVTLVDRKGTRAILNMDELVEHLQRALPKAKILRQAFELLPFREQLEVRNGRSSHISRPFVFNVHQLVARSDVLIAVHGAALALLPFLDVAKKARVVELLPHGFGEAEFYSNLARAAGVSHVALPANSSLQPASVIAADAPMESGLVVDTEQVVRALLQH